VITIKSDNRHSLLSCLSVMDLNVCEVGNRFIYSSVPADV